MVSKNHGFLSHRTGLTPAYVTILRAVILEFQCLVYNIMFLPTTCSNVLLSCLSISREKETIQKNKQHTTSNKQRVESVLLIQSFRRAQYTVHSCTFIIRLRRFSSILRQQQESCLSIILEPFFERQLFTYVRCNIIIIGTC
jgi:hypothetical protein